jgi:3-oxoacyl-[acyl-carrier protein] reductase
MAPSATSTEMPAAAAATLASPQSNQIKPLAGKVALITGSGRGIGRGIAIELGKRGASIVINYGRSASAANEVVATLAKLGAKSTAIQADVSSPEQVSQLFAKAIAHFGGLDYVVSNSGMEVWCEETDVTPELFDQVFNLNTRGQFFVAQHGLKHCNAGGRIILTSSIAAQMAGIPNHALYAGSKAAVEGFTRAFAVDCGKKNITCNAIAPGGIITDMFDANAWHYAPNGYPDMPLEQIKQGLASVNPLGRVGTPEDIGKVVYTLISDEGGWINGKSFLFLSLSLSLSLSPSPLRRRVSPLQVLLLTWS